MEPDGFVACYRELAPRKELRDHVRALFTFGPAQEQGPAGRLVTREILFKAGDPFCSPVIADGNGSLVIDLGMTCGVNGVWQYRDCDLHAAVMGGMTGVGENPGAHRPAMIGVYFSPARLSSVMHVPACELTDRVVSLEDLWATGCSEFLSEIGDLDHASRIDRFEVALLHRIRNWRDRATSVNVPNLAWHVLRLRGRVSVETLADAAGVSRQHLTRVFREQVGLSPKLYCRLARFQAGLRYVVPGCHVEWAQAAVQLGYADQSHMIAEFREFSSATPDQLIAERWFHPFIERAKTAAPPR